MKAGDVTVYNQARGKGKRMGLIPYIWAGAKKYKVKNTKNFGLVPKYSLSIKVVKKNKTVTPPTDEEGHTQRHTQ